jgi:hypothetical protein
MIQKPQIALTGFGLAGWLICGATIGIGRHVLSMDATLILHAAVAPVAFLGLAWGYSRLFPAMSAKRVSGAMLTIVVALDAFLVAPFIEHSYAMFGSWLGTWLPFASIAVAAYAGAKRGQRRRGRSGAAVEQVVAPVGHAAGPS